MGGAAQQQAAEQQGHQGIAGQDHANAQHVIGQGRRLVLGNGDHAYQRQHHDTQATDPAAQELDLGLLPAEMQFGDTTRREDAVGGVEHHPGLGELQQGGAQVGVLPAGVELQGKAAQAQGQGTRQGQQDVDQNGLGRVPLAVALEVADIVVHLGQACIQVAAAPDQGTDQQRQRQE
ncbi:hypothetical protein D3C80_1132600 [compost metagenome]